MSPDRLRTAVAPVAVVLAGLVAAVAVGAATWFGVAWARAGADDALELGLARDEALRAAGQAAVNLTTQDPANVQQTLALWEQSATGPLLARFGDSAALTGDLQGQAPTRSTVEDSALTALDLRTGSATALVALSLTVVGPGAEEPRPLQRLELDMVRTADGWKATDLVPVGPPQ